MNIVEIRLTVRCPITGKPETVYCRRLDPVGLIDCNGCENANGDDACKRCQAEAVASLHTRAD